ncbi:hypothetical protein ABZW30_38375 [Kitasatospora sp. NPDC004669]|uniref:hypothetical protein n=1 Tax=Kitasatospora sp. NPDC004669 TaxID=3154555 RepID=UPI0033AC4AD7
MAFIKIEVTNESTVLTADEVKAVIPALQTQVHEHLAPIWGIDADLSYVEPNQLSDTAWWLVLLDNSDQAGALGYHDVTSNFMPLGKVFAGTDKQFGQLWTVTASHELLEMLGDPEINTVIFDQPTATTGVLYAQELCDTCEADDFAYPIDGVQVSDFVFPAWFQPNRTAADSQYDYGRHIKNPLELLPGGYIGVFDVTAGIGWTQKTADERAEYRLRAHVGSRRERRRIPRDQWLPSRRRA